MAGKPKIPDEAIARLIKRYAGDRSMVARTLGYTRQNLSYRIERSQALQDAEQDTVEDQLDKCEFHIQRAVRRGDTTTMCWYMDRFREKQRLREGKSLYLCW